MPVAVCQRLLTRTKKKPWADARHPAERNTYNDTSAALLPQHRLRDAVCPGAPDTGLLSLLLARCAQWQT